MVKSHTCHLARPAKTIVLTMVFLTFLLPEGLAHSGRSERYNQNRPPYQNSKHVQHLSDIDLIIELYLSSPAQSKPWQWNPPKHSTKFTFCNLKDYLRASQPLRLTIDKLISRTTSRLTFSEQTMEQHSPPTHSSMEKSLTDVFKIIQLEYQTLQQCNTASTVFNYNEFQVRLAQIQLNELPTSSINYDIDVKQSTYYYIWNVKRSTHSNISRKDAKQPTQCSIAMGSIAHEQDVKQLANSFILSHQVKQLIYCLLTKNDDMQFTYCGISIISRAQASCAATARENHSLQRTFSSLQQENNILPRQDNSSARSICAQDHSKSYDFRPLKSNFSLLHSLGLSNFILYTMTASERYAHPLERNHSLTLFMFTFTFTLTLYTMISSPLLLAIFYIQVFLCYASTLAALLPMRSTRPTRIFFFLFPPCSSLPLSRDRQAPPPQPTGPDAPLSCSPFLPHDGTTLSLSLSYPHVETHRYDGDLRRDDDWLRTRTHPASLLYRLLPTM